MLKTFRWIYKLGVKHERRRIAAFLQNAQHRRYDSIRDNGRKQEYADQILVDRAVIDIITQLFSAEEVIQRGRSQMYPEDEEL